MSGKLYYAYVPCSNQIFSCKNDMLLWKYMKAICICIYKKLMQNASDFFSYSLGFYLAVTRKSYLSPSFLSPQEYYWIENLKSKFWLCIGSFLLYIFILVCYNDSLAAPWKQFSPIKICFFSFYFLKGK